MNLFKIWIILEASALVLVLTSVFAISLVVPTPSLGQLDAVTSQSSDYQEVESVSLPVSGIINVRANYNQSLENGFCLFGRRNGSQVYVEEVKLVENPIYQDESSMTFYCIDEVRSELPSLLFKPDYKLVGNLHTHPENAELSDRDTFTFGMTHFFQDVMGVYNGNEFHFESPSRVYGNVSAEVRYGE